MEGDPMSQSHSIPRRTFMKAAGAGAAVLTAGCLGAPRADAGAQAQTTPAADAGGLDPAKSVDLDRIAADPTELPDPVDWSEPRHHEIELEPGARIAQFVLAEAAHEETYEGDYQYENLD